MEWQLSGAGKGWRWRDVDKRAQSDSSVGQMSPEI